MSQIALSCDLHERLSELPTWKELRIHVVTLLDGMDRIVQTRSDSNVAHCVLRSGLRGLAQALAGHDVTTSVLMSWLYEHDEVVPRDWVDSSFDDDARSSWFSHCEELAKLPYAEYLLTPTWKARREKKIEAAFGRCQVCNSDAPPLHVHHRTYDRRGYEGDADLTVLCADCHRIFHEHGRLR